MRHGDFQKLFFLIFKLMKSSTGTISRTIYNGFDFEDLTKAKNKKHNKLTSVSFRSHLYFFVWRVDGVLLDSGMSSRNSNEGKYYFINKMKRLTRMNFGNA